MSNTTSASAYSVVTSEEAGVLQNLRHKGYAVVIFDPEELQGVKPRYVEDALVEQAWVIIDALKDTKEDDWLKSFKSEFLRRTGITWNEGAGLTDKDAFDFYYPQEVADAVQQYIEKYDLTDFDEMH